MSATHVFFTLHGHVAALSMALVRGAHGPVPLFPLEGTATLVAGLATVEGRVVTVLDPRRLLHGGETRAPADLLLLLDGDADGMALTLELPVRVGCAVGVEAAGSRSPLQALGSATCLAPDGHPATIIETERLVALSSAQER